VVAQGHLWPRSFSVVSEQPSTSADKRSLTEQSEVEERRHDQEITVTFDGHDDQPTPMHSRYALGQVDQTSRVSRPA
jgi:hypothetical protein